MNRDLSSDKWWVNENGQLHRLDGPSLILKNGSTRWFINNKRCYNRKEFQKASGLSDEEITLLVLKYGKIR